MGKNTITTEPEDDTEGETTKLAKPRVTAKPIPAAELPDAEPPEKLSTLAAEYIGLSIAGGLVVGVLIGAFFPRSAARRLAKGAGKVAAVAGQVGMAYATNAIAKAGETAREGREKAVDMGEIIGERTSDAREKASRLLGDGAEKARDAGSKVARRAAEIVAKARG